MASFTVSCPKLSLPQVASSSSSEKQRCIFLYPRSGFRLNPPSILARLQLGCSRSPSNVFKAAVEKTSTSARAHQTGLVKELKSEHEIPDALSISIFMDQVSDLIKLVDSRDIVELQLKQMDCELLIRKKEALPHSSPAAPVYFTLPPTQQAMQPPQLPPTDVPVPTSTTPASTLMLPAPTKSKASHPPFKCPMAGNFIVLHLLVHLLAKTKIVKSQKLIYYDLINPK